MSTMENIAPLSAPAAAPRRRFRRLVAGLLKLIGSLLLVAALLYLYAFWQCWHLEPTGDLLFDRFAHAVRARNAWRLYGPGEWQWQERSLLPEATVARWETDFSSDPRYWQLRYVCRRWDTCAIQNYNGRHISAATSAKPAEPPWGPLQHAADAGIADAQTYMMLYGAKLSALGWKATQQQRAELLPLLDKAIDLNPDLAWAYYLRAMNGVTAHGENWQRAEALIWLTKGNTAKDDTLVQPFPLCFIEQRLQENNKTAGSRVLCGALQSSGALNALSYRGVKNLAEAIGQDLNTGGERDVLQSYMKFLYRFGSARQAESLDLLMVARALGGLSDQLATSLPPQMTPKQRKDVQQLFAAIRGRCANCIVITWDERSRYVYRFSTYIHLGDLLSGHDSSIDSLGWYTGLAPAYQQYAFLCDMRIAEQTELLPRVREKFRALASFDYVNLRMPEKAEDSSAR